MNFRNKEHFNIFLKNLKVLGMGSQGVCFLDEKNKIVYKVFHEYFDNEECSYRREDILKFSNIDNKTFIWPKNILVVEGQLVGYTMPYVNAKSLYENNPLQVNLNSLETAIESSSNDIKLLTSNNIALYDVMYNILYRKGKFSIIDTMEYSQKEITLEKNMEAFNHEIKLFLVDNYFNNFVSNSRILSEMYIENISSLQFLKQFRKELSNTLEENIITLSQAKSLIKRSPMPRYIRSINWNDNYE